GVCTGGTTIAGTAAGTVGAVGPAPMPPSCASAAMPQLMAMPYAAAWRKSALNIGVALPSFGKIFLRLCRYYRQAVRDTLGVVIAETRGDYATGELRATG